MSVRVGVHQKRSGLIVRHGSGRAGELIKSLSRNIASPDVRVGVFDADAMDDGHVLEPFMHDVRATDVLVLVHVVEAGDDDSLATELTDEVVDGVVAVESTLRRRFPALVDVDSWVLVDLGRTWSQSARTISEALLKVASDNRIRSILAVTGSTAGSVAGDPDDRAGMLADAAWALAVGALGDVPGMREAVRVWAVGSNSFTLNSDAWAVICTSLAVAEAIEQRPLQPAAEGMLDEAKLRAAKWVESREIGTDAEKARILSGPQGDTTELLAVRRDEINAVRPEDWATATDREYLRLAGAPLARFTRVVEGNAEAIAHGRAGEDRGGHVAALDDELTAQLRSPAGCLRAARFVNGLSSALSEAARKVANSPHADPREVAVTRARRDLELAVMSLAKVRPWIVRMALLVVAAAVLVQERSWLLAVVVPFVVAGIIGVWGAMLRRRAVRARDEYVGKVEDRLRALSDQRLLEAQLEVVKRVQSHAGAFLDDHDSLVDMEVAAEPPAGTRAAAVKRIWDDLHAIRDQFRSPESALHVLDPVPSCGHFFASYPQDPADADSIASNKSAGAKASRGRVRDECDSQLQKITLDWDRETITTKLTAACVTESEVPLGVHRLTDLDPDVASEAIAHLSGANQPQLDVRTKPLERCVIVAPDGQIPPGFESIVHSAPTSLVTRSADPRRISVVWLAAQDFASPPPKPFPASDHSPSTGVSSAGDPGIGFVDGGI